MGMETLGNTGIVAGGHAGITPTIELNRHDGCCNDGWGGSNAIWPILLLALFNRRGFGGDDCGNGYGAGAGVLPVQAINQNTDWNGLLTNQNINQNAQLAAVADAKSEICTTREAILNGFGNTRTELAQGFGSVALEGCRQTNQLGQIGLENRYQAALGFANTDAKMAACCCETQKEIMQNRYLAEKNTCDIIAANTANTQRILDKMACNEIQTLRDQLAETRLGLSQCNQNSTLINALRPTPIPAYPVYSPTTPIFNPVVSANSFCGAGVGTSFGNGCGGCL